MTVLGSPPKRPLENPLKEYRRRLNERAVDDRAPEALKAAAELVEYAAYEMARSAPSSDVETLILLAADLERRGVQMKKPLS